MSYMKYTQYVYLLFAAFFVYDGITKFAEGKEEPWLSFIISGMAIFMFFFRRRFIKKLDNHNKNE